jgi:malonate transporter
MGAVALATLPIFLVIFLGAVLKAWRFPPPSFWEPAERLVFYILLPALLVATLASADLSGLDADAMAGAIAAALLAITLVLLLLKPVIAPDGPAFTSVFQGATRMNTYIGLAVAFSVHGGVGLAAAAVAVAVIVPLGNVLGIAMLARYGRGGQPTIMGAAKTVIQNPLILACLVGIGLNLSGLGLPPVGEPFLRVLGRGALPLALLAIGAALDLGAARAGGRAVVAAVGLKLLVLPAITALACAGLGVGGVAAFVAILFNGSPASPISYVLARRLGGDAHLMAGIVTVQTALAVLTLPAVLALLAG